MKKERKIHLPSFPPSSSLALYSRGYREERKRQKRGEIGRASSFGPPDEKKMIEQIGKEIERRKEGRMGVGQYVEIARPLCKRQKSTNKGGGKGVSLHQWCYSGAQILFLLTYGGAQLCRNSEEEEKRGRKREEKTKFPFIPGRRERKRRRREYRRGPPCHRQFFSFFSPLPSRKLPEH